MTVIYRFSRSSANVRVGVGGLVVFVSVVFVSVGDGL